MYSEQRFSIQNPQPLPAALAQQLLTQSRQFPRPVGRHLQHTVRRRHTGCRAAIGVKVELAIGITVLQPQALGGLQLLFALGDQLCHQDLVVAVELLVLARVLGADAGVHLSRDATGLVHARGKAGGKLGLRGGWCCQHAACS